MQKLADLLVNYSCKVQPGERVQIDAFDIPDEMACALIQSVVQAKGLPFVENIHPRVRRTLVMNCTQDQLQTLQDRDLEHMKKMDCYIAVRGGQNITENSDVPEFGPPTGSIVSAVMTESWVTESGTGIRNENLDVESVPTLSPLKGEL